MRETPIATVFDKYIQTLLDANQKLGISVPASMRVELTFKAVNFPVGRKLFSIYISPGYEEISRKFIALLQADIDRIDSSVLDILEIIYSLDIKASADKERRHSATINGVRLDITSTPTENGKGLYYTFTAQLGR